MDDMVTCCNCGNYFDYDLVEDGFAICPHCECEVEVHEMTKEKALERYDRIRYSLLNQKDKVAVDVAFDALKWMIKKEENN